MNIAVTSLLTITRIKWVETESLITPLFFFDSSSTGCYRSFMIYSTWNTLRSIHLKQEACILMDCACMSKP